MKKYFSVKNTLIKFGLAMLITYLSVATALPVISIFVKGNLHLPNWLGGAAVGISFISTIMSRKYAGNFADTKSSKKCFMIGFLFYILAAFICMVASLNFLSISTAFIILIIGRLILGVGESMTLVGISNWHFSYLGPVHSGKILAVMGMAMYGAFALGGPIGLSLYNHFGFEAVMAASAILPFVGIIAFWKSSEITAHKTNNPKQSFTNLLIKIWKQGLTVSLQGIGFALLGAFISLYFKNQGWPYAGMGLSLFGIGFVISRIFFGTMPDKIGGVKVAFVSLIVEAIGQGCIWIAPNYLIALSGALLTGLGCSMIYPAMGVEVIKKVSPDQRATALGGFSMFQDVSYAFSAPIGGIIADHFNYASTFLCGFIAALFGIIIVFSMFKSKTTLN